MFAWSRSSRKTASSGSRCSLGSLSRACPADNFRSGFSYPIRLESLFYVRSANSTAKIECAPSLPRSRRCGYRSLHAPPRRANHSEQPPLHQPSHPHAFGGVSAASITLLKMRGFPATHFKFQIFFVIFLSLVAQCTCRLSDSNGRRFRAIRYQSPVAMPPIDHGGRIMRRPCGKNVADLVGNLVPPHWSFSIARSWIDGSAIDRLCGIDR